MVLLKLPFTQVGQKMPQINSFISFLICSFAAINLVSVFLTYFSIEKAKRAQRMNDALEIKTR